MKKNLFFISVAVLALGACTNDNVVEENNSVNQPKEIAFKAIATPSTRAAVADENFPTTFDMKVAAYQVSPVAETFFDATTFKYQYANGSSAGTGSYWGAETTGQYWPLSAAQINFLAIADANSDNATGVTWNSVPASGVTIAMADNKTAQHDLMYAIGSGAVTQSGNSLAFPDKVDMVFKHAQAWVKFNVQAGNTASEAITINSITLNQVSCQGTYTITHTNYNAAASQSVAGVWTLYSGNANNIAAVPTGGYTGLSASAAQEFASLMVIPDQGMTSFTINYSINGHDYDYTYTPATSPAVFAQATKYTYNITLTLHEILVAPEVTPWTAETASPVSI